MRHSGDHLSDVLPLPPSFTRCGIRGGYMEMMGVDSGVLEQLYKLCSTRLCSNTLGQVHRWKGRGGGVAGGGGGEERGREERRREEKGGGGGKGEKKEGEGEGGRRGRGSRGQL